MNVALTIVGGFIVAVLCFPLGPFWIPTVALYFLGRRWLTVRGRKISEQNGGASSSFGLWFRCMWGWTWGSFLIFVIPLGIFACALGGNDPEKMGWNIGLVIAGWIVALFFVLDTPVWSFQKDRRATASGISKSIYDQVAAEFQQGSYDQGLWLKAIALAGGDQNKALALYTTDRASFLVAKQKAASVPNSAATPLPVAVMVGLAAFFIWSWIILTNNGKTPLNEVADRYLPAQWSASVASLLSSPTQPTNAAQSAIPPQPVTASTGSSPFGNTQLISADDISSNSPQPPLGFVPEIPQSVVDLYNTGLRYENGVGVTQSYATAMDFYQQAALKYDTTAMIGIARLYRIAPPEPNLAVAVRWYEKAVSLGDPQAMTEIGILYQNGIGFTQDFTQAMKWYKPAAAAGNADAMYSIGFCYEGGWGVDKDIATAVDWYKKAAAHGSTEALRAIKRTTTEFGDPIVTSTQPPTATAPPVAGAQPTFDPTKLGAIPAQTANPSAAAASPSAQSSGSPTAVLQNPLSITLPTSIVHRFGDVSQTDVAGAAVATPQTAPQTTEKPPRFWADLPSWRQQQLNTQYPTQPIEELYDKSVMQAHPGWVPVTPENLMMAARYGVAPQGNAINMREVARRYAQMSGGSSTGVPASAAPQQNAPAQAGQ